MGWQEQLIQVYEHICQAFQQGLGGYTQRFSYNDKPVFTDEEVMTIYLYGLLRGQSKVRDIYDYTKDHLMAFFPRLPSYQGYIYRLNRCSKAFEALVERLMENAPKKGLLRHCRLVDSMPIILANEKRSDRAKVALTLANKGYCASKNMYYHGVKLHLVALARWKRLPFPEYINISPGAESDLTMLLPVLPQLYDTELYGDKIYAKEALEEQLEREQKVRLYTPVKRAKGQEMLDFIDRIKSENVSRIRQPIESIFNWFIEKTDIQNASKIRSEQGLMRHIFGKLAAAMFLIVYYS
jgi:hypothetical protein